jgi:hypothetical protein
MLSNARAHKGENLLANKTQQHKNIQKVESKNVENTGEQCGN